MLVDHDDELYLHFAPTGKTCEAAAASAAEQLPLLLFLALKKPHGVESAFCAGVASGVGAAEEEPLRPWSLLPLLPSKKPGKGGGPCRACCFSASCRRSSFNCSITLLLCTRASHCDSFCSCCNFNCASSASIRLAFSSISLLSSAFLSAAASGAWCAGEFSTPPHGHHDGTGVPQLSSLVPRDAGPSEPGKTVLARPSLRKGVGKSTAPRTGGGVGASPAEALRCRSGPAGSRRALRTSSHLSWLAASAVSRLAAAGSTSFLHNWRGGSELRHSDSPGKPKNPWPVLKSSLPSINLFSSN
mmetsp:Transcript_46436/g.140890  ORF Transcript_46436/g.140890 Transcript_46436/m.140890 type:complete len:301 (+) Transcript_46436:132-1034(+)